uniref:WW domain-containing protein n=1 Tax=Soboliphyme baturini TaxID=241478 RepID=A0A183ICH3_9BILA
MVPEKTLSGILLPVHTFLQRSSTGEEMPSDSVVVPLAERCPDIDRRHRHVYRTVVHKLSDFCASSLIAIHHVDSIAIFVSLACVLIWLGYALFHCAWASFLLRDEGGTSVAQKGAGNDVLLQVEAAAAVDGPAGQTENYDPKNTGYWKFVDDEPWQVKCNRNELR